MVQGNLEQLEEWAIHAEYKEQYNQFLGKVTALISLLATPKNQLIKVRYT